MPSLLLFDDVPDPAPAGCPAPGGGLRPGAALGILERGSLWRADQLERPDTPTLSTGWPALDAELPGGGWPLAGLTELLLPAAGGELALLAPWLRALGERRHAAHEPLWVEPPGLPCVTALQALGLAQPLCVSQASAADAAWAVEQALRAGSFSAVLWWSARPVSTAVLRRLHLAAQAGGTPLMALRLPAARTASSPAPLRLACTPWAGRQLAVEVFKRRGPPMAAPLALALPWPASARRPSAGVLHAVDRVAPAPVAPAGAALV